MTPAYIASSVPCTHLDIPDTVSLRILDGAQVLHSLVKASSEKVWKSLQREGTRVSASGSGRPRQKSDRVNKKHLFNCLFLFIAIAMPWLIPMLYSIAEG